MYHLKQDLRAIKSAELLYEGLIECMKEKDFEKISISDISSKSSVGRATFYRNFDTIVDILYWKCNQQFKEVITKYVNDNSKLDNNKGFIEYVFQYWMEHVDILDTLINIGRVDIIYNSFMQNSHILTNYLHKNLEIKEFNYDYFISLRVGIFIGIISTWIENGKKESAEDIANIIEQQIQLANEHPIIF